MTDFPHSPSDLTSAWLSDVLRFPVEDFSVEPLGEGVGILGLVTRITLKANQGPKTLIGKFQSPVEGNRDIANLYNMYEREYVFYTEIAPTLSVRSPQCHFSAYDPNTHAFCLLLEDLKDYRVGDQLSGCSVEECESIVRALAALHAATWMTEDFKQIGRHNSENQVAGMQAGLAAGWPKIEAEFNALVPEGCAEKIPQLVNQIPSLLDQITQDPICISHGDLRLDNIFFADDHVALVDFQAVCRSAPEHDLAYFLTQSLSQSVRQNRDWLHLYHEELVRHGVDYPFDACQHRFKQCALYFLCYAVVIASALDLANERGQRLATTILTNSFTALVELDALALIE